MCVTLFGDPNAMQTVGGSGVPGTKDVPVN